MVDFPEGYGFEPRGKAELMRDKFHIEVGQFVRAAHLKRRDRSPWEFKAIGYVYKEGEGAPIQGRMYVGVAYYTHPRIEGTLQQVVTAMCTIHRMKGSK